MRTERRLSLALLDYKSGKLTLSGQHEQLIIVRRDGRTETLERLNAAPDAANELANFVAAASVQLQPGDGVVLYTHGIIQAENEAGQPYGLERLSGVVGQHWGQPAETIKQAVIEDVHQHLGSQTMQDDLTLVIVKQN
jgi:sigma-B regulation protein RsbU (phosphoserine phosphatase)